MRRFFPVAGVVAAALAVIGCGGGESDEFPREPISGKVTLNGQPLTKGLITFSPFEKPEPVVTAAVLDGAYSLERSEGPSPGLHRVQIFARKPSGRQVREPDNPGEKIEEIVDAVPPRYNVESDLTAGVEEGGDNLFHFDLQGPKVASRSGGSERR